MMKKRRSWRSSLLMMLIVFVSSMAVFFIGVFIHFYQQRRTSYRAENQQVLDLWNTQTENRLAGITYQIHELMIEMYMDMQAAPGKLPISWKDQKTYLDQMDDALMTNTDVTCFYIIDTESDYFLFNASDSVFFGDVQAMKQYVRREPLRTTTLTDPKWYLITIGHNQYFSRSIPFGRYIVGSLSDVNNYPIAPLMEAYDREFCLEIIQGDEIVMLEGQEWNKAVKLSEESIPEVSGRYQLYQGKMITAEGNTLLLVFRMPFFSILTDSGIMLAAFAALVTTLLIVVLRLANDMIVRPTSSMMDAVEEIGKGNLDYQITEKPESEEFETLFDSFNNMTKQIQMLKIEAYDRQIEEQQQELTRLRQQLVPHFYLNAITTVSNMTYQNDGEEIRSYLQVLAKYMRYMMNLKDRMVSLGSELEHVNNYLELQQARFPDSVYAYIGCPERLKDFEIPYLLIFTLVENTIKHAMDLYSTLQVLIQCEWLKNDNFEGCRITVEDNGPGFDEKTLEQYQSRLEELPEAKEHIGLTNVIRTLQLTYHRNDLIQFSNAPGHGAHIELYIPKEIEKEEKENDDSDL